MYALSCIYVSVCVCVYIYIYRYAYISWIEAPLAFADLLPGLGLELGGELGAQLGLAGLAVYAATVMMIIIIIIIIINHHGNNIISSKHELSKVLLGVPLVLRPVHPALRRPPRPGAAPGLHLARPAGVARPRVPSA